MPLLSGPEDNRLVLGFTAKQRDTFMRVCPRARGSPLCPIPCTIPYNKPYTALYALYLACVATPGCTVWFVKCHSWHSRAMLSLVALCMCVGVGVLSCVCGPSVPCGTPT